MAKQNIFLTNPQFSPILMVVTMLMSISEQIIYWRTTADRNWETARYLYKGKRYDACLFFCHLSVEKLLKGLVVKNTKEPPPYMHNLARLAELAQIILPKKLTADLKEITAFNIAGRYDDEKYRFYKKCTSAYATKWLKHTEQLILWLKKSYPNKF